MGQQQQCVEAQKFLTKTPTTTGEESEVGGCIGATYFKYNILHDKDRDNFKNKATSIHNLRVHIGQIANLLSNRPQENLPSNTKTNPKEHVKATTLRSDKLLKQKTSQFFWVSASRKPWWRCWWEKNQDQPEQRRTYGWTAIWMANQLYYWWSGPLPDTVHKPMKPYVPPFHSSKA